MSAPEAEDRGCNVGTLKPIPAVGRGITAALRIVIPACSGGPPGYYGLQRTGRVPVQELCGKFNLKGHGDATKTMGTVGADGRCLLVPGERDGRTTQEAGCADDGRLVDCGGGHGD